MKPRGVISETTGVVKRIVNVKRRLLVMKEKKVTGSNNFGARGWLLVIYAFLVYLTITCIGQIFNVTGPYYQEAFGWDVSTLMGMFTIAGIIAVVFDFFAGTLAMRVSPKKMSIVLGICFAICMILLGFVQNLAAFLIIIIVMKLFSDAFGFMMVGNLMANWFPRKRGAAMGWATFGMPLAGAIGATILRWSYGTYGIKWAYVPYAVLVLICLLILIFFLSDYPEQRGCHPDNDPMAVRIEETKPMKYTGEWTSKKILTNKNFWLCTLAVGLMMYTAGFMPQVSYVLIDINFNMKYFLLVMYGIAGFACLGSWIIGMLDVKLGTKKAFIIACCFMIVGGLLALIPWLPTTLFGLALYSVTLGGGSNLLVSFINGIWGRTDFAPVFRWSQPLCNLIISPASWVVASFASITSYRGSFGLAAIIGVVAMILILFVKKSDFKADITIHEHLVSEGVVKE